jgi:hypothetical protein
LETPGHIYLSGEWTWWNKDLNKGEISWKNSREDIERIESSIGLSKYKEKRQLIWAWCMDQSSLIDWLRRANFLYSSIEKGGSMLLIENPLFQPLVNMMLFNG